MDKLYEMEMNEVSNPNSPLDYQVLRVPGGWIYRFSQLNQVVQADGTWSENYFCDSVFVPFDNEFMKANPISR